MYPHLRTRVDDHFAVVSCLVRADTPASSLLLDELDINLPTIWPAELFTFHYMPSPPPARTLFIAQLTYNFCLNLTPVSLVTISAFGYRLIRNTTFHSPAPFLLRGTPPSRSST